VSGPAPARLSVAFVLATTAGGTGAHVRCLAAGLTDRGCEVAVFGPAATRRLLGLADPPATRRQVGAAGAGARFAPVEIADRPRPLNDLAALARLRRLLRRRPAHGSPVRAFGVVHAHGLRAGGLAALALGGALFRARRGGPALIVTLHNAPPAAGPAAGAIYRILERIVARRADGVLCVSDDLTARMRRRGARCLGRAVVAAPTAPAVCAQTARAARAGLGAAGRPLVLAVGRLAPQKGFGTLLAATAYLRDRDPPPLVAIAGEGPQRRQLAAQIASQRLPLVLLGHRDDIPALLAAADVFVLPSMWEGQPLILQEALRAGRPIVASRTGGIADLTGDDAALLVPAGDPARLAAAMARVLAEPALAARLAAAAAQRARSLPGEAAAVDAALAAYQAVITPPSRQ